MLEVPSTDNTHYGDLSLSIGELNSVTKYVIAYDLMLQLGTFWMLYSKSSTTQDTILPSKSGFFKIW